MFIRVLLIIFIVLMLPGLVFAEPEKTLTLQQALDTAITNNPQFKATQAKLGIGQAEIVSAGARLNPALTSDNGIAEKTYRLGIEKTFELGGKRQKRVAVAEAQKEALVAEINIILLDLRTNVRRGYTDLYNAQQHQKAAQEIIQVTEHLLEIARKREEAGDIAAVDVLQTDIANLSAKNELQATIAQVTEARNRLNALLNQPLDTALILAPPSEVPQTPFSQNNLDDLLKTAFTNRPELQQLQQAIEVTKRQKELAYANRVPNLSLAVGPDWVVEPGQDALNVFIVGNLEIPLFNRQQGPIQEALARQTQLEQEMMALTNKITLDVTNAFNALTSSRDRVMRYETELLPKLETVVEKSQRSFEEGKASILVPINAQQAYINTRLGYLKALMDYQNAISDLERAVGTGL